MAKITKDARKKAIKAAKEKGIQIPEVQLQSVEFVGNVTFANRIYDYVTIDGISYPLVSAYGYFKVKDSEGGTTHLALKEWRILPSLNFPSSRLSWSPVSLKHDVGLLMHWPSYRERIRRAKLGLLFVKVKARIKVYIKFENENLYDAVTLWILASHFNRIFNHFPILDLFKAGYNAGGSVAMKTIISYCPRPMLVQDPTEASLFRSVNDFRPTVGIEEFTTDMDEDKRKAILTLLDGAFDKSVKIARTDNKVVKGYDFFGPKIIVDPQAQISRYSTSSRTLFAPLINSPGFNSDPDTIIEHDKELIQTLYDSFIVYAKCIDKAYRSCKITGDGRIDQAFRPLLAVAMVLRIEGIDVIDNLIKVLQEQFERREMIKSEGDISKQILTAVYEIVSNDESRNAWFTEKKDGSQIFYLRISNLRNAISNWLGIEFQSDKSKNNGVRYWKRPPKEVAEILQDGRRFSALLSTFLYENVGNVEPGSRHLCLFYTRTPSTLIDRLISVIGFRPTESHNSPNVGYQVDPLFSEVLNKKNKKFPQKRIVSIGKDELRIERRRSPPRNVGNFGEFFFLNPLILASACNTTMWWNVGNCGSRAEQQNKLTDSTNSGVQSENQQYSEMKGEGTDSQDPISSHGNEGNELSNLVFRRVFSDNPIVNPDPKKYPKGKYFAITKEQAREINAFHFSKEISYSEFKANGGEIPNEYTTEQEVNSPISETDADDLIKVLLKEGFFVNSKLSGPSIDGKLFEIVVTEPENDTKMAILIAKMEDNGFMKVSNGKSSEFSFTRKLKHGKANRNGK